MERNLSWVVWPGIISLFGLVLMALSCGRYDSKAGLRSPGPGAESDRGKSTVYIENVVSPTSVSQSRELQISVSGNLPSPAYSFARFDVDVRNEVITITPRADYDEAKMVAQVLVPFDRVCIVKNLQPGTYEVRIVGRTGEIQSRRVDVTAGK